MQRLIKHDFTGRYILNRFVYVLVLSNATYGYPQPVIKRRVRNQDVSTIRLERYAIIAIDHDPAIKVDIVAVDGIRAIGIAGGASRGGSTIDVDVLQENARRLEDCHGPILIRYLVLPTSVRIAGWEECIPHLTLHQPQTLHGGIRRLPYRECLGSIRVIRNPLDEIVPGLAVAIESPTPVSVHLDVIATEPPRRGLVLVAKGHGVLEPVGDVGGPLDGIH